MAQQQIIIADFIEKINRRKAGRPNPYLYDDTKPISSNRGNKLNRNAKYVRQGRLNNSTLFKQRIDHAGYQREIISLNPPYYTPEGDMIENESDIDEDDETVEENIYKHLKLEELLAPLTSAAELPNHPTLSQPYKDKGLPEMIRKAEEQLHEEQRILWQMKNLFTQFRGDAVWAPVGTFHSSVDDEVLGTRRSASPDANFVNLAQAAWPDDIGRENTTNQNQGDDIQMADDVTLVGSIEGSAINSVPELVATDLNAPETSDETVQPLPNEEKAGLPTTNGNGTVPAEKNSEMPTAEDPTERMEEDGVPPSPPTEDNDSSNAPSHRMTTRAQAVQHTHTPSLNRSVSPTSSLAIAPFFTFPSTSIPDANFGIPAQMGDETRHALTSYISKQEEIVRNLRQLHENLLSGLAMRQDVWTWTKAEGHLDEMSDHEDWVDLEEWGIEGKNFKKGMQEDEGDEEEDRRVKRVRRVGRAAKE